MNGNGRNMYVFREGRRSVDGSTLVEALAARVKQLTHGDAHGRAAAEQGSPERCVSEAGRDWAAPHEVILDALVCAGELECALSDQSSAPAPAPVDGHSPEAERLSQLTDLLAAMLVGNAPCLTARAKSAGGLSAHLLSLVPREVPARLHISPPEGFAYYALHPLDFADLSEGVQCPAGHAAVIGIRSIGTTLSAVVRAALEGRGLRAERITVRPTGHPYDRRTEFSAGQLRWIAQQRLSEAMFLVVDEGPGMSGSSFLSVGEALLGAGVERARIQFLCSREPQVEALCARNAAARWRGFRASATHPAIHIPADAKLYLGGGYWRHVLMGEDPSRWPASWSQMERLKFLSPDRRFLFKFEGFSRFGKRVRERAEQLSRAGYATRPLAATDGFGVYPLLEGDILTRAALDREVLERMADYCAYRARAFRCGEPPDLQSLNTMVRFNVAEEFGVDLRAEFQELPLETPVLVDGRMQPNEWVRAHPGGCGTEVAGSSSSGQSAPLFKCDGTSHGDDHFFPGPATDICWDLAGAILEWDMSDDERGFFLRRYRAASGEDCALRLPAYLLAYAVFRLAYCKMAAAAMHASAEEERLLSAYSYYRRQACRLLPVKLGEETDVVQSVGGGARANSQ